ncbi:hypothetical protein [Rhizobium sp. BK176]|uniref:hypothetical protein n=1 Tax=Rhizobium sp. BK176 TaxID=2587071 RepID=UPI002168AB88|nr:hypothetical protein [Rhizobium sp. BK176]MCS4088564.1 hypothetical protein [Rhizobium sp. BK176]
MISVKFEVRNALGEQVQAPMWLDVDDVPNKGDTIGLFGIRGAVDSVDRVYERGNTRSGVKQEITVTIRAN